ncbi:MAG: hypothetical protein AABY18_01100 [Candidatus Thermoplasmatota archaeon]
MQYDLSLSALINAGGAFLFLALGAVILVRGRGTQRGRLIGGLSGSWGLALISENLLDYDRATAGPEPWIVAALTLPVFLLAVALAIHLTKGVTPSWRRFVASMAVVQALAWVGVMVAFWGAFEERAAIAIFGTGIDAVVVGSVLSANISAFIVLLAACVARFHAEPVTASHDRRAMVGLTLAFGLFTIFLCVFNASAPLAVDRWEAWLAYAGLFVHASSAAIGAAAFVVPSAGREPRLARSAFIALLAAGALALVVVLVGDGSEDYGAFGILRTISATLLAFAIVKHDLLKVPWTRVAVRSGVLAGGALAVLFIVAQVAQNFFSAEYGLLMGGILAGTFVFAASPIQRAIERSSDRSRPDTAASTSAVAGYKAALRAAMRDGTLTRREERHLAEVAMALGISAMQALDLRDEVEREPA